MSQESGERFGVAFAASGASEPGGQGGSAGKVLRTQGSPVIDFGRPAFAGDGDALLSQMRGKVGAVVERGDITIGEAQFEAAAVLSVAIAR